MKLLKISAALSACLFIAPLLGRAQSAVVGVQTSASNVTGQLPSSTMPQVIHGVSYSDLYPGSTVDVRVNACIVDAETRANGNTSGVCDARAEGGTQTIANQITVGDSSFHSVTLLMPSGGTWTATMTDGTSCAIEQWGNTSIIGANAAAGLDNTMAIAVGTGSNLAYNYCTGHPINTSGSNYYYVHGISFVNYNAVTANNVGNYIAGAYDGSTWDHDDFYDQRDGVDLKIYAVCCGSSIRNSTINANYVGQPLQIVADSTFGVKSFNITSTSIVHPGAGLPTASITDTSTAHDSTVSFSDVYTETGNADTTTALYQVSGFGQVNFKNLHLTAETASTQSYAISVANVGTTTVNIDNVSMTNGAGSWLTHKVLQNVLHSTNWSADTNGHFGHYDDNTLTTAGVTVPVDSTTTAPFAAGTGTNTSGMSWSAGGGRASGGFDSSKGLTVVQSSSGNGVGFYVNAAFLTGLAGGVVRGGTPFWVMGTAIASAATIAPANGVVHVTGTTQINTITAPSGCLSGYACLVRLIPDGLWTTGTSGNIALATTAVVNRPLDMTYDQATLKWYPSYVN